MKKLLIVDDNEQNLYMLQVLLSANGFQVEQASNGAEALECARRDPPIMIISDLLMPVMDGYTLLHDWKNDELLKTIPFVVYTATYTDAKDEHLARSLGADDFILKPTESEAFMARIQNVLVKAKQGKLSPVREPASDKKALMNEYSEVLIRKLEEKALQLQHANRTLEEDIAERKKTEIALRLDGEIMANMAEGVQLTRENDAVIVYANSQFEKMFGYRPGELLGKHVSVLNASSEKSSKGTADDIIRALKNKGTWDGEILNVRKNGATFWCHASISTFIHPDHGKVWISVQQDISERKQAEESLRQSEARYRVLFEQAADIILQMEIMPEGMPVIRDVNSATLRLLGYERDELINQPVSLINVASDPSQTISERRQNVLAGPGKVFEARHRCKDGRILDFECSATELQIGSKTFAISVERDITERKKAEQKLQESEEKYRSIFENVQDVYYEAALDGTLLEVSPSIEVMSNGQYHRIDLVGKSMYDFYYDAGERQVLLEALKGQGSVTDFKVTLKNRDGSLIPCSISSKVLCNAQGNPEKILGSMRDITRRVLAEESLRESEKRYRTLVDGASEAILVVQDGKLKFVNHRGVELSGYLEPDLLAKPFLEFIYPDDRKMVADNYMSRIKGEPVPSRYEFRFLSVGGSVKWVEISAVLIDWKGMPATLNFLTDITERKQAEEVRRRNSRDMEFLSRSAMALVKLAAEKDVYQYIGELLKEIVPEKSVVAVSEFDESSRVFHGRNIIGLDKTIGMIKKILGKDPMEISGDFGPEAKKALLSGKLQKIDVGLHDFAQILPAGILHPVEKLLGITAFYVIGFVKEGKVLGGLSIILRNGSALTNPEVIEAFAAQAAIAITKRKAEQALQQSEERYRTLFDDAKDGIALADAETGRIVECNQALCAMVGMDKTELVGQMQSVIHPPQDLPVGQSASFIRHESGEPGMVLADQLISKVGTLTPVEIKAARVQMNGRDYMLGIFRDVSERKQHEKEREHLQAQLLQAQKMEAIGTLAGGVAHDFNNLLTAISGFTTIAMGKTDESSQVQRDLRQVSIAASKAAGLTRQLLLFSRKQHMEPMPMDPNATVSRLLKMLGRLIGEDIAIETDLEKDIWHILGDEGNVEQVLMNLSVNARDAMPQGGKLFIKTENVTIDEEYCHTYHAGRPGHFVCLSVSDTGTGMDQLTQDHIFEPFFTTKGEGKGTGLGLSVVLGIVQQHKGWINVYSEPGHGTTFKVYFPSSSARAEQKGKEEAPLASLEGKGERIMVVEDQAEVRELAVEILTSNGYSAFPVSSAKEAKELFEKENGKFDLVFSDVVLTDTTGILLVEELLRRWKFKVMITSGYTDEKANWDFIKEKNFRFLHKPYTVRDLLLAVREVLGSGKVGRA
jgi:PAS domain S-box-containing protein